jgi:hypothetical protein
MREAHWTAAGQGGEGAETLGGWSRSRRAIVRRRRVNGDLAVVDQGDPAQLRLAFAAWTDDGIVDEDAVLITSRQEDILTPAQGYRDRAAAEKPVDELKNPWGWGGFPPRPPALPLDGPAHRLDG